MDKAKKQLINGHMMRIKPRVMAHACSMALATMAAGYLPNASAGNFELENGDQGQWAADMSLGSGWRTSKADPSLISTANGGLGGTANDDGDLNYAKGSAFSTILKVSGEMQLKHDNLGFVLGGKAWYDYTQSQTSVEHGSFNNGYAADTKLDDSGFYRGTTFSGTALGNAYVFGTFEPIEEMPITVKLGNHVVNWGESMFIPGINQFGAFDVTASHQAGSTVKEILRPIPQLFASMTLSRGLSIEGFYHAKWEKTLADGCGTYWGPADGYNCPKGAVLFGDGTGANDQTQHAGVPLLGGLNFNLGALPDRTPKNGGQYGLASHYFAEALSTDFGIYFANYHQRTPIIGLSITPTGDPASLWSGNYFGALGAGAGPLNLVPAMRYFWDYSIENIKATGISAATEVLGWSLSGEASYTKGIPVQISAVDLLIGTVFGAGPMGALAMPGVGAGSTPVGSMVRGYDLKNKTQLQFSTIKILSHVAGADSLTLVGEVGAQHWSGIGDPNTSTRYSRSFVYGFGSTSTVPCAAAGQVNPTYCSNDGYATSNAWGYRLQGELNYPNAVAGVNLKPRIFWSHDVEGYSPDGTFLKGRQVLGLALRADYLSKYYAQISYSRFNHSATYDAMHDRDNATAVFGINF